jgi:ubiquinone/menaquinone biosynthesis C-methylase UbiE
MLRQFRTTKRSLARRIIGAARREVLSGGIYGVGWGDPDIAPPLRFIRDRYLLPYVNAQKTAVEIGPGGGRWTRYMLGFKTVYVVDYYADMLNELAKNVKKKNVKLIRNNGTDFPGIEERCIDYLFSFGAFVHLDTSVIEAYLANMKPILKPGANVVIHYSDKTKIMAQLNKDFAENTPEKMRRMVLAHGYTICEEDTGTMWHSSVIRFTI